MKLTEHTTNVEREVVGCPWEPAPALEPVLKSAPRPYLRGPIPWAWLQVAADLGSGAVATGLAVWHLRTLNKSLTFKASLNQLRKWTGLSQKVTRDGLHRLEAAGLLGIERPNGSSPKITLIEKTKSPINQHT